MNNAAKFFTIVLILLSLAGCKDKEPQTTCLYGDDVGDEKLQDILSTSDLYMSMLVSKDYNKLYELGSEQLKQMQTKDQFTTVFKLFEGAFGDIDFPMVEEVYYMKAQADEVQVWIPCNLGEPNINDLYLMPANEDLAVTHYRARTDLEILRVVMQMEKDGDKWLIRSIEINPMTIKHKRAEYYLQKALKYREENKLHLASLYYKTAILLSEVALNAHEYTVKTLTDQLKLIKVDYMPGDEAGNFQVWSTSGGGSYQVYNLDSAYEAGKLLVQISYMADALDDEEKLKKEAEDLAAFLDGKFPEYREGFDGVRVTAASMKAEQSMMSYHTTITWDMLDTKPKKTGPEKTGPVKTDEKEGEN